MEFMAFLFGVLFVFYTGMNIWDYWHDRKYNLFTEDGRFLRHQYQFLRLVVPREETEVAPDAKFAVQLSRAAYRCEVCHQSDLFDTNTGFCQRCDHQTR